MNQSDIDLSQDSLGSLAIRPTLELDEFIMRLHDYSATICTEHFGEGLSEFHVARTPARFKQLGFESEEADEDGSFPALPYPKLPSKPARPAANASAATLEFYKEESRIYLAVRQGVTALRNKLLASVGEVILDELRSLQAGGLATLTLQDILVYLDSNYGEPSEDDLKELSANLSNKFTAVATFRSDAPKMKATFQKLSDFGQEVSALQKMTYLQDATDLLPPIVEALKDYKKEVTSVKLRSFDDMVAYVKQHVPLTTAGSASYVGATVVATRSTTTTPNAKAPPTASEIADELFPRFLAHFAGAGVSSLAGRGGNGGRTGRGGGRGNGDGRGGRGAPAANKKVKKYCFWHGYGGHHGIDCNDMAADPSFTEEMKNATAPCTIDGYHGEDNRRKKH